MPVIVNSSGKKRITASMASDFKLSVNVYSSLLITCPLSFFLILYFFFNRIQVFLNLL